tara:strand:- start:3461 stop:5638 length:2178 start_codon:yes stop_codon:yes gene_type:complete
MATSDTILAGLSELADLYTKSKALDLAETQFQIQREGAIADRAFTQRQLDIAENKAISSEKLGELNLMLSMKNDLQAEKRVQEKILQTTYNVAPQYSTSGLEDITTMLSGSMDDKISGVGEYINLLDTQLSDINTQISGLQAEERYYADAAARYSGLNQILQEHEFETLVEDAKQLPQFEGFVDEADFGAGFRAAFTKEMPAWRRQALSMDVTNKMNKESKDRAAAQYSAMQTYTASPDFDWAEQFGSEEMGNAAKQAFTSSDYSRFLAHLNMPGNESLKKVFQTHLGFNVQLGNIEANAAKAYALDAELMGQTYTPTAPKGNFLEEYETIVSMADLPGGGKASAFEAYTNFISGRGITDKATVDSMFAMLEDKYGEDLGPDFKAWLDDPEGFGKTEVEQVTGGGNVSELTALDQLIADYAQTETERGKITGEQKKKKDWSKNVNSKYNQLYSRAPSSLQSVFDRVIGPKFETLLASAPVDQQRARKHAMKFTGTKGADLTDKQWLDLDNQVALTVSTMLQQPAPGLEEVGLGAGGMLLSTVGIGDEDVARDMLKTGKSSALSLLKQYSEYKAMTQERPEFSPEVKELMEKYGIGIPTAWKEPATEPVKKETAENIGAAIDAGFGQDWNISEARATDLDRATLASLDNLTLKTVYDSDDIPYDPASMELYSQTPSERPFWDPEFRSDWEEMFPGQPTPWAFYDKASPIWDPGNWGPRNPFEAVDE